MADNPYRTDSGYKYQKVYLSVVLNPLIVGKLILRIIVKSYYGLLVAAWALIPLLLLSPCD